MTYDQIRHVLEIAKTESINQAANNLFLTQSALSLSIKTLEKELGHEIFIRHNKGVSLTSFGRTFVSYAQPIKTQMEQLQKLGKQTSPTPTLSFKVASNGFRFVSRACSGIYEKYKTVGIRLEEFDGVGDETLELVANHTVEIGIVRYWSCYKPLYQKQLAAKSLNFYPLASKRLCILVGQGSPLYRSEREQLRSEELWGYPMIMHEYMDSGPYSDILDRLQLGKSANRIITSSRAVIYDFLETTDGYYLSSALEENAEGMFLEQEQNGRTLKAFYLEGSQIESVIGWVKHSAYTPGMLANEFIARISSYL
ncbi:MAG: LysR family transcriptional regulator [Lachnospiraceae bacterium]|nr:LysR family transcriptional regulator [Lachnospiraceae bacterium]